MPPRARSNFIERLLPLAALLVALALLPGCNQGTWPDREGLTVDSVAVDSLKVLPIGSRYVLADSPTAILFQGFPAGFACSRISVLDLAAKPADSFPSGYRPRVALQLPASPECPIDSAPRDSVILRVFTSVMDGDTLRLFGSRGGVTSSAAIVRGRVHADSLVYVTDSSRILVQNRWLFHDTAAGQARFLRGSLTACEHLNQAEYAQNKDTARVRFTWVTLDGCSGEDHVEEVPVSLRRF